MSSEPSARERFFSEWMRGFHAAAGSAGKGDDSCREGAEPYKRGYRFGLRLRALGRRQAIEEEEREFGPSTYSDPPHHPTEYYRDV